jgi:subtilisin family serine protease
LPSGQTWNFPLYPHGTHVAGILMAQVNNNIGIAGVVSEPSDICLHVARIFDDQGTGQLDSVVLDAVEWCADQGAQVINLSLGSPTSGTAYAKIVYDRIVDDGAIVVAASGNTFDTSYNYPASFPKVMSVAAVGQDNTRADFSSFNDRT